jgi:biopolymer transport protein ExbB/TolQ
VEPLTPVASDFSIYGLVMHADPVVKGVLILLVIASIACWAVIFEKLIRLIWLRGELSLLREAESGSLEVLSRRGPANSILSAGEKELEEAGARGESVGELRGRLERAMRLALKSELHRLEVGLPFLATVGSAAPFVGLFGTVWGIVNSFTSIAQQKDTSLAVVAPGIAEALIATALGLAAAIPAVIAYNQIAVSLGRASVRANASIAEIAKRLARPQAEPHLRAAGEPVRVGKHY